MATARLARTRWGLAEVSELDNGALLQAEGLTKYFPVAKSPFSRAKHFVHAVDGISFSVPRGGSLGLVGESGSGKRTTAKLVANLLSPTAGTLTLAGENGPEVVAGLKGGALKNFRRRVQDDISGPVRVHEPP